MGYDAIPSTGLAGTDMLSLFGGAIDLVIWFLNLAMLPLFIFVVSMVLYYYTGEKKRADEFMPNLMAQVIRIFTYVWLLLISIGAYAGASKMVNFIFTEILPDRKSFLEADNDSVMFFQGLLLLVLMSFFAAALVLLNRKVVEISGIGAEASVKYFVIFGMLIFSTLLFISSISVVSDLVTYIDNSDRGIDAENMTMLFTSATFFGLYLVKGMRVLKTEPSNAKKK